MFTCPLLLLHSFCQISELLLKVRSCARVCFVHLIPLVKFFRDFCTSFLVFQIIRFFFSFPPPRDPRRKTSLHRSRRGFRRQPENSKCAHSRVPAFHTPPKIQREDPQREKKSEHEGGRWKNNGEILGPPPLGPPPFGPHPSRPNPSSSNFF